MGKKKHKRSRIPAFLCFSVGFCKHLIFPSKSTHLKFYLYHVLAHLNVTQDVTVPFQMSPRSVETRCSNPFHFTSEYHYMFHNIDDIFLSCHRHKEQRVGEFSRTQSLIWRRTRKHYSELSTPLLLLKLLYLLQNCRSQRGKRKKHHPGL